MLHANSRTGVGVCVCVCVCVGGWVWVGGHSVTVGTVIVFVNLEESEKWIFAKN